MTERQLKFGIEIEISTKKTMLELCEDLADAGIKVKPASYGSAVEEKVWKVQPDSSINGWEIVSPPLNDTEELIIVVNTLRHVTKAMGSKKCGIHVHHDVNDLTVKELKNVYELYAKYEMNAIHSILPLHRFKSFYCQPIFNKVEKLRNVRTKIDFKSWHHSRYLSLNHKSYIKYGTLEFRAMASTINIDRILSWVELTHKMVEVATQKKRIKQLKSGRTQTEALEVMIEELNLSEKTSKHYRSMHNYFKRERTA